jgi:prepilin-type N-terminal cleavage/methylation domain-containing protein
MTHNMKGVTLVELMLAMTLGGVIAAYTHFSIQEIIEKNAVHSAATSLEVLLQGSYEASQYFGTQFLLIKNIKGDFVATDSVTHSYPLSINTKHIVLYSIHSSLRNSEAIQFHPNGYTSPGRIELHSKNYSCILRISMRGRVRRECAKK